jgi:hypothetical protein
VDLVKLLLSLKHDLLRPLDSERRSRIIINEFTDVKRAHIRAQTVFFGALGEMHELGPFLANGVIIVDSELTDGEFERPADAKAWADETVIKVASELARRSLVNNTICADDVLDTGLKEHLGERGGVASPKEDALDFGRNLCCSQQILQIDGCERLGHSVLVFKQ